MKDTRLSKDWPIGDVINHRPYTTDTKQPKGVSMINAVRGSVCKWIERNTGHFYIIQHKTKLTKQLIEAELNWMTTSSPSYSRSMITYLIDKYDE